MPSRCAIRAGSERAAELVAIRQQAEQNAAIGTSRRFVCLALGRVGFRHGDAERLDKLAVLDARWTGGFAGAAIEAQLEMPLDARARARAGRR